MRTGIRGGEQCGKILMAKLSRSKGKAGELEVVALLREHGFDDARRGVQYNGATGAADVIGLGGCHVEVKRTETLRLHDALAQAARDAKPGLTPVVFHRRSRGKWIAILPADEFLEILNYAEHGGR